MDDRLPHDGQVALPGLDERAAGRHAARLDPAAPLAERMRPRDLDEIAGQGHLLGSGRLIRRLAEARRPASLILWGPAGVGKTTLARVLAAATGCRLVELSATSAGVRQVRETGEGAARLRAGGGDPTLLFIDEIHRFHKGQQDALLPWVESGAVVLVGATTENPSFEVVAPLLSRCRVVRLHPLEVADLTALLHRAASTPPPRGLGGVACEDGLLQAIAERADGDARAALTTLEIAAGIAAARGAGGPNPTIGDADVREALQRPHLRYDREEHFNQISALQKSIRNSDADAALYWLARLLEAGEDPLYVARRLVRTASEDVGLADPAALGIAIAALQAVHAMGLPEGALALAQATVHLAAAPKSNSLERGYGAAVAEIDATGALPVPMALRNPTTPLMRRQGYGRGYAYAHDRPEGVARLQCLPDALVGKRFYDPSAHGAESATGERLRAARAIQDAAATDDDSG